MKSEYVGCGLYPENIDVNMHEDFRTICYMKNGTINGIYVNELVRSVENVIKVFNGNFEIVELVDRDAASILAHNESPHDPHILRGNAKTDLKRVSINKIPKNTYNKIISFIKGNYGTKYGTISYIVNKAMDLYIKLEKGYVKLVRQFKKPDTQLKCNNSNQKNLYDAESLVNSIELLNIKMDSIEQFIEKEVKPSIQSTLDIPLKSVKKAKTIVKNSFKSFRSVDKFEKALNMLENVMKYREFGFTDKDYHRSLVRLMGQGDMRTVRSDLDMLEADNRIKKMRNSSNGVLKYQFINNNQYHRYNSELAKNRFLEGFGVAFQNINALTVDDLNDFIFSRDGLYDTQSQYKRLWWLIDEGLIERHEANPRLLFITK